MDFHALFDRLSTPSQSRKDEKDQGSPENSKLPSPLHKWEILTEDLWRDVINVWDNRQAKNQLLQMSPIYKFSFVLRLLLPLLKQTWVEELGI